MTHKHYNNKKQIVNYQYYKTKLSGDIIHLVGYYPPPPTTDRPSPLSHSNRPLSQNAYYHNKYKPTQATNGNYHQSDWGGHETNHLSGSHAFTSTNKPIHHIGLIDESGFELSPAELYGTHDTEHPGGVTDGGNYAHNSYDNDDSDVYKPVEGIFIFLKKLFYHFKN